MGAVYHVKLVESDEPHLFKVCIVGAVLDGTNLDLIPDGEAYRRLTAAQAELVSGLAEALSATATEINQVCDGVGETVTAANLTELTDGSQTSLHSHAGGNGGMEVHDNEYHNPDFAEAVHEHLTSDLTDLAATAGEINQALDGITEYVTAENLDALVGGETIQLHGHLWQAIEGRPEVNPALIEQVCGGAGETVTGENLTQLTNGSQTAMHIHQTATHGNESHYPTMCRWRGEDQSDPDNPEPGDMCYRTDLGLFRGYADGAWRSFGGQ